MKQGYGRERLSPNCGPQQCLCYGELSPKTWGTDNRFWLDFPQLMKRKHDRYCKGAWETRWQADTWQATVQAVLFGCWHNGRPWLGEQLECDIIVLGVEGCEKWEKPKPPDNAVCVFFSACSTVLKRASPQMLGPEGRQWATKPSTFWVTSSKWPCSI